MNLKRKFRAGSPLKPYLHRKYPHENILARTYFYIETVLRWIKAVIATEGLHDENNATMVLCDPDLEEALQARALHLNEIRTKVMDQLVLETEVNANVPFPTLPPPPLYPKLLPRQGPPMDRPKGLHERPTSIPPNRPIRLNERFKLKPLFLNVLRTLDTVESNREIFMYEELSKFLSQYIIKHKQKFFDLRNIKAVVCDDDPLGAAFNVRAFHRTQVMTLLRLMLIRLTPEEEAALGPEPPSQARAQQALYQIVATAPPGSALSAGSNNGSALYTLALTAEHRRALTLPTGYREPEADSDDSSDSGEDSDTTSATDSDEDSEQMSATASEEEEEDPELRATYAGEMEPVSSNDSEEEEEREEASLGIEE